MCHAFAEFAGLVFTQEEVHIVELDGICAVVLDEMGEDGNRTLGRLELFLVAVGCVHTTEAAVKGAADAGVVDGCSFPEERRAEIFFNRDAMEGGPWELVRSLHGALPVVAAQAEEIFVEQTLDGVEFALAAEGVDKFQKCVFALTANHVVDITCVERRVGIDGREVASPADGHLGPEPANLTRGFHGSYHLGTGHRGDAEEFNVVSRDEVENALGHIVFQVAVYNLVIDLTFEGCGEGKDCKREPAVAWLRGARMIEDDHVLTCAV